jgi:signal transduction histidine kinase
MQKKLDKRGARAFWLLGAVTLLLSSLIIWVVLRFRADASWVDHSNEVLVTLARLRANTTQAESSTRGFMITLDPRMLSEFENARQNALSGSERLLEITEDNPDQIQAARKLKAIVAERLSYLENVVRIRRAGSSIDEIRAQSGDRGWQLIASLDEQIRDVRDREERLLSARSTRRKNTELGVLALSIAAVVMSAILLLAGQRSMRQYRTLRDSAQLQLEKLNAELESRVLERTANLEHANEDLRKSQRELSSLASALARSNARLEAFAYAATHDLQEPLRTISTFGQLIQRRYSGSLDPEGVTYLNSIVEASLRMGGLLRGLLDYSRLNRDTAELIESVPLSEVIETVKANLRSQLDETGAEIHANDLPCLDANRLHLMQLFQNLLSNSIKYRASRPLRIDITARRDRDFWNLQVADNGVGFKQIYSEQIFGMFKRLDRAVPGAGVGLAICRTIVEKYGGEISAEGVEGQGATIHIRWPAQVTSQFSVASRLNSSLQ